MARETKETTIEGTKYRVVQVGAKVGRKVALKLGKVLASGAKDNFAESLNDDDVDFLCEEFSKVTEVFFDSGKALYLNTVFDEQFAGKYFEMYKWLEFCIELNFGDSLKKAGLTSGAMDQAAK